MSDEKWVGILSTGEILDNDTRRLVAKTYGQTAAKVYERVQLIAAAPECHRQLDELLAAVKAYRAADTLEALALNLCALDLVVARIEGGAA